MPKESNQMTQQFILDRMVKIVPRDNRLYELMKYDQYWHRYDGKTKTIQRYDKTLCDKIFKSFSDENYKCDLIENFKDLPICPSCLKIWYEVIEKEFEDNQLLGKFELSLWDENAEFLQLFIENEGYDKLNETVNDLLFDYLRENKLLDKLSNKVNQKQN